MALNRPKNSGSFEAAIPLSIGVCLDFEWAVLRFFRTSAIHSSLLIAVHSSLVVVLDLFALRASACELPASNKGTAGTTELQLIKKLRLASFII
jgi:hypothetical protein